MLFKFIARCGTQSVPLQVTVDYRPGKQAQRARRKAVGELLFTLEATHVVVDASGEDVVHVKADGEHWVIE